METSSLTWANGTLSWKVIELTLLWQLTLIITAGLVNYKYLPIRRGKLILKHKLCYFCWACYYFIISNPVNNNISKVKYVRSACNFTKQHLLLHINSSTWAIPACQVWVCTHCTQPLNWNRPKFKSEMRCFPVSILQISSKRDERQLHNMEGLWCACCREQGCGDCWWSFASCSVCLGKASAMRYVFAERSAELPVYV